VLGGANGSASSRSAHIRNDFDNARVTDEHGKNEPRRTVQPVGEAPSQATAKRTRHG
jgi:hypothetical protein